MTSVTRATNVLEFGPYTIDRAQRLLRKGTNIVPLAPKVFDLLVVFAESAGQTLDRETLLKKLWPDAFVLTWQNTFTARCARRPCLGVDIRRDTAKSLLISDSLGSRVKG